MAISLEISDEKLQLSFQEALNSLLQQGNYRNPVDKVLDEMLGYSGTMKGIIGEKIKQFLELSIETPKFQQQLGEAIAKEMAKRAVNSLEKKK